MGKTVGLSKAIVLSGIFAGLAIILIIGLSSGLGARPHNCKKNDSTTSAPATTATSTRTTVSSSGTSSTTRSTASSGTTTTTTTTRTNAPSTTSTRTTTSTTTTTTTAIRTTPGVTTVTTPTTTTAPVIGDVMLPKSYDVEIYNLKIFSHFVPYAGEDEDTSNEEFFKGEVAITFGLTAASNSITLHADDQISITSVKLHVKNNQASTFQFASQQRLQYQKIQLTFTTTIPEGEYTLELSFGGNYGYSRRSLEGFYLSKYKEDGKKKTVAATQFAPTDARRAFPCFDEPSLKAAFVVTIQHPKNTIALSNWPGSNPIDGIDENNNAIRLTTFQETKKMSTYLLAWAIVPDDYGFEPEVSAKGTPIRVFSKKSAVQNDQLKFAAQTAKGVLDFYQNEYFGIDDAVPPKIDLITIPQFSYGAMENWGLVAFRETALLYSDTTNSLYNKQSVATYIAHELAHFWFGNLVTCSWWNDLWLNEAMASFLEEKAVDHIHPEFGIIDQFITSSQIPVMYDDGFYSTHPVYTEVAVPDEILSIFDSITYDKGAALLRMLEATVSADNFKNGLKAYISSNKFSSGKAEDFYNNLTPPTDMTGVTIKQYMENWLNSRTYPWVLINLENNGPQSLVRFSQDRFYFNEYDEEFDDGGEPDYDFTWMIYFKCRAGGTEGSPAAFPDLDGDILEFTYFLNGLSGTTNLPAGRKYTWVKCNTDFKGFYIAEYEIPMFQKFADILVEDPQVFSPADQAELIHAIWTLSYAEYTSYSLVAEMTEFLAVHAITYVPWRAFSYHISKIATILEHRTSFYGLSRYAVQIYRDGIQTWPDSDLWNDQGDHLLRLAKINAIDTLGRMQDFITLQKASEVFNTIPIEYFTDPTAATNPVPPNLRGVVYKYHVQNAYDVMDWYKVVTLFEYTTDPQEKSAAMQALSYSRLPWILDELMDNTLGGFVSDQDVFGVLASIGRNPTGRGMIWNFIRANWDYFYIRYGSSIGSGQAIRAICESFDNRLLSESMFNFYLDKPIGSDRIIRIQTLYIVEWNQFWVLFKEREIIEYLFGPLKSQRKNPLLE